LQIQVLASTALQSAFEAGDANMAFQTCDAVTSYLNKAGNSARRRLDAKSDSQAARSKLRLEILKGIKDVSGVVLPSKGTLTRLITSIGSVVEVASDLNWDGAVLAADQLEAVMKLHASAVPTIQPALATSILTTSGRVYLALASFKSSHNASSTVVPAVVEDTLQRLVGSMVSDEDFNFKPATSPFEVSLQIQPNGAAGSEAVIAGRSDYGGSFVEGCGSSGTVCTAADARVRATSFVLPKAIFASSSVPLAVGVVAWKRGSGHLGAQPPHYYAKGGSATVTPLTRLYLGTKENLAVAPSEAVEIVFTNISAAVTQSASPEAFLSAVTWQSAGSWSIQATAVETVGSAFENATMLKVAASKSAEVLFGEVGVAITADYHDPKLSAVERCKPIKATCDSTMDNTAALRALPLGQFAWVSCETECTIVANTVTGSQPGAYSGESRVCTAALHATSKKSGTFALVARAARTSYTGNARHGVTTRSSSSGPKFSFEILTRSPTKPCDCAGTPAGSAKLDNCTQCHVDVSKFCKKDCAGEWKKDGEDKVNDQCGKCGGNGKGCLGCDGKMDSNKKFDTCYVCDGDGKSCLDCAGVVNGGSRWPL
jgi:hypothetical protein